MNLKKIEDIQKLRNFLAKNSFKIDVLVNNVGIAYVKSFENIEFFEIEEQIELNLKSIIYTTKIILELINENGIIVNMGSIASKIGFENWSIYSASKFALRGLTQSLRKELSSKNIRVSLILPGAVWTPIWERNNFKKSKDMLSPDDIAMVVKNIIELPKHVNIDEIIITHVKRAY